MNKICTKQVLNKINTNTFILTFSRVWNVILDLDRLYYINKGKSNPVGVDLQVTVGNASVMLDWSAGNALLEKERESISAFIGDLFNKPDIYNRPGTYKEYIRDFYYFDNYVSFDDRQDQVPSFSKHFDDTSKEDLKKYTYKLFSSLDQLGDLWNSPGTDIGVELCHEFFRVITAKSIHIEEAQISDDNIKLLLALLDYVDPKRIVSVHGCYSNGKWIRREHSVNSKGLIENLLKPQNLFN